MPLTPQEQSVIDDLDKKLPQTKTIDNLKQCQEKILKVVEDERAFNKSEFAKGTEKFKEISSELREVNREVSDMKSQISSGFKDLKQDFINHVNDSKDNEIKKLNKRLDRTSAIKDGVLSALVSGILLAVALYFLIPKG